jgi:hypothetical protein
VTRTTRNTRSTLHNIRDAAVTRTTRNLFYQRLHSQSHTCL